MATFCIDIYLALKHKVMFSGYCWTLSNGQSLLKLCRRRTSPGRFMALDTMQVTCKSRIAIGYRKDIRLAIKLVDNELLS